MKTTELFNFRFVDRTYEREILNNFFMNKSEDTLWIKGNSGFGKTTFFNYVVGDKWKNYLLCYVNIRNNCDAVTVISDFIIELQSLCNIDFLTMVKNKYKHFYNSAYKNVKNITNELFPNITNIVSIILDLGYNVVTLGDEHKQSTILIIEYIRKILENKKLCICIDNFSNCNMEIAEFFFQIFKSFLHEEYFRSCIITTSENLSEELIEAIHRNLTSVDIQISELDKYIYFCEILEPIFDLSNFEKEDLIYLYNKCNGSPKTLSTLISKLLEKNGIIMHSMSKAQIEKRILFSILQSERIRFRENDFEPQQKWIIFSYLCLTEKIHIDLLRDFALFISQRNYLYQAYTEPIFQMELMKLIDNKILNYTVDNMITICHDSDYRELMDIFQNFQLKKLFSQYAYEFLLSHSNISESQELLCWHAREAEIPDWEQMNFRYGESLAKSKRFYNAQKIFARLDGCFEKLHPQQILFIAKNSYETGNYHLAIKQLDGIRVEMLKDDKEKYYYYFFLGKSYNNIGYVTKAAQILEMALQKVSTDSKEYAQTLNVLHMYYFEIPEKFEKSSEIFYLIKDKYKDLFPEIWANTMRGCHNFLENQEALEVLKEATDLLDNKLEKAFINTTKGFLLIKADKINDAKEQFEIASQTIKELKIHEYSYAANNLAVCYMLDGNYSKAKEILIEALLWNRTDYANLVIETHLMISSYYLGQQEEMKDYFESLKLYMENQHPSDPIINRKIYLNLAIISDKLEQPIMKKGFLLNAEKYVKNTTSEWRYYLLLNDNTNNPCSRPSAKYQLIKDFEPWFLVYAHD